MEGEVFAPSVFCTSDSTFPSVVDLQDSVFLILGIHSIELRFIMETTIWKASTIF